MTKKKYSLVVIIVITLFCVIFFLYKYSTKDISSSTESNVIKVGYLPITPNLPFYVALKNGLFKKRGLKVIPVPFKTSNQLIEALITNRIQFTTVTALSVLFSLEAAAPNKIKIYQVNYIIKSDPNDFLLVKKDSPIKSIKDLKGKKIALFPGSNFNVWAKIIFGDHFKFGNDMVTISLPPANHIQAVAAGSIDASYCLEPTATIGVLKGIVRVLDVGLVCKYIFNPFPVTGNAVLSSYAENHIETTKSFCETMNEAIRIVQNDPKTCRQYLVDYCKIPLSVAQKVKLGHGKPSDQVDIQNLDKVFKLYKNYGIVNKNINVKEMLLYPPSQEKINK